VDQLPLVDRTAAAIDASMTIHSRQTSSLIGVSNSRMLGRGFVGRCPVCGSGGVIQKWFGIVERCPTCDLQYNRVEGHVIGYIGLNTIFTFSITFVSLIVTAIVMVPHVETTPLVIAAVVPAAVLPILLLPSSRMMWTAIDLIMRPLDPGEIDPRFFSDEDAWRSR
jgi:uncharacterized protein (DUF983 family)